MRKSMPKKVTEESFAGTYVFTFHCDQCGSPHRSPPFTSGMEDGGSPRAQEDERNAAFEKAADTVISLHFNRCPKCGMVVCEGCYTIVDGWDMCKVCAGTKGGTSG